MLQEGLVLQTFSIHLNWNNLYLFPWTVRACLPSLLHAWETKPFSTVALLHALKILNLTQKNRMEQVFSAFGQKLGSTFGFDCLLTRAEGRGRSLS